MEANRLSTKDLMVGDWLYYKGQFNAFPFKVESITKEKVVNYPYSRLIDYNGIRSIDIIKKL